MGEFHGSAPTDLGDQAVDMLINSGATGRPGVGSLVGVGSDEALEELIKAGLATPLGRLTKAGALRARRETDTYFNRP